MRRLGIEEELDAFAPDRIIRHYSDSDLDRPRRLIRYHHSVESDSIHYRQLLYAGLCRRICRRQYTFV